MSPRRGLEGVPLGAALFAALAVLAVLAFTLTQAARSADDIVNTVTLAPTVKAGGSAEVTFTLAEGDGAVDVTIIEPAGSPVRRLERNASLDEGVQRLTWDGRDDDGRAVAPGLYALQVVLKEAGRDIRPPGRIRVLPGAEPDAAGGKPSGEGPGRDARGGASKDGKPQGGGGPERGGSGGGGT